MTRIKHAHSLRILSLSFSAALIFAASCISTFAAEPAAPSAKKAEAPAKEAPIVPPREGKSETLQLFNGKNLDGWVGHEKYWSVKDGVIVGKSEVAVPVSTYLLTKRNFSDFRLVANCKLVAQEIHSGIAFWGRIAPEHGDEFTYAGPLVIFPNRWGLHDLFGREGIRVKKSNIRKYGHQHDWNEIEILALGNHLQVAINGRKHIDWRDPEPERIKEGPIALQLHDESPQEVHFKDLVLTTFPEDKLTTLK